MLPGRVQSSGTHAQTYGTRIGASAVVAERAGLLPSIAHAESTQTARVLASDSGPSASVLQPDVFVAPEQLRRQAVRAETGPASAMRGGSVSLSQDTTQSQTITNATARADQNYRPRASHDRRPAYSGTQIVHIPGEFQTKKNITTI
jgi:hypothetical protein